VHAGYEANAIDDVAIACVRQCYRELIAVAREREYIVTQRYRARYSPQRFSVRCDGRDIDGLECSVVGYSSHTRSSTGVPTMNRRKFVLIPEPVASFYHIVSTVWKQSGHMNTLMSGFCGMRAQATDRVAAHVLCAFFIYMREQSRYARGDRHLQGTGAQELRT
jgi:hypothetical protein